MMERVKRFFAYNANEIGNAVIALCVGGLLWSVWGYNAVGVAVVSYLVYILYVVTREHDEAERTDSIIRAAMKDVYVVSGDMLIQLCEEEARDDG